MNYNKIKRLLLAGQLLKAGAVEQLRQCNGGYKYDLRNRLNLNCDKVAGTKQKMPVEVPVAI